METQIFKISGMSCDHCIITLENELHESGFENVKVEIGLAKVEFDGSSEKTKKIILAIQEAGYEVV